MLFAKVPQQDAEAARNDLLERRLLDTAVSVEREGAFVYLPVTSSIEGYELVERAGRAFRQPKSLREALAGVLAPEELDRLTGSYDVVGSIAILDIDASLVPKEGLIASAIFATHKQVKTVLKKAEKHGGEFRTQGLALVAGEDTRETLVRESGAQLLVDVEQVYFSVRSSTERLRIASMVQAGERVLVLFSGAAPFVVVLARHTEAARIVGVEKNPAGHEYGLENVRRNKVKNAELLNADASDLSLLRERFDRIIMPHPSGALDFLAEALSVAAERAVLHIYLFGTEEQTGELFARMQSICRQCGFSSALLAAVKAGHHAPYIYRWCFDLEVRRAQ